MTWEPLKFLSNWLGSTSVSDQKKAEAAQLFVKAFDGSEVGNLMKSQLKATLNKPFSQQLAEARQNLQLQGDQARLLGDVAVDQARGHSDVIGDLNTRNTDLKIRFGDAATQNEINKLRAKADLMNGLIGVTQAHELAVMDRQSADAAANRTHEARNDGFLKVMGIGDLLARIGGAAMLIRG